MHLPSSRSSLGKTIIVIFAIKLAKKIVHLYFYDGFSGVEEIVATSYKYEWSSE